MGYVAIKGGERAIAEASRLLEFLRAAARSTTSARWNSHKSSTNCTSSTAP